MCGVRSQVGSVGLCGPDQPLDGAGECEMSFGGRLSVVIGLFVVAAGFAVWAVVRFMLPQPATVWKLPPPTRSNLTSEPFDSGSRVRHRQWGRVQGTLGNVEILNGRLVSVYDSNSANGVGHTFSIPTLGINIPLVGVNPNASNVCSQAPCSSPSSVRNIIRASFVTPGPGDYPWQCFVPCGLGFLYGNGGPMSTVGYMGGFLAVVS